MFKLPVFIESIFEKFKRNKYQIYLIGGAVRDLLLKKQISNWDFTTNAKPEEILKLFPKGFYDNQFGTVGISFLIDKKKIIVEITTFRKEGEYLDYRHPQKIKWAKTIEEDLARRDFTINALAFDGKKIIDVFDGQKDLKNKIIRAVGDPDKRFKEDALRLMRAIRLASQLGFYIEDKTRQAIIRNANLITKISWERIREEFFKILESNYPSEGILFLRNSGLLKYILWELDACFSIPQKSPNRHHIFDVGTHLVMSLKFCQSKDVITRLATLIHDIGKAKTFKKNKKTGLITFYNHEVVGAKQAQAIGERFCLSNKQKEKLITLVKFHQFSVSEKQTDKALRRFIRHVGKENLEDIIKLRFADRLGSRAKEDSWRFKLFRKRLIEVQKEPFKITDLKISGYDVMEILKIKPGPKVGQVLKKIFDLVVDGRLENKKDILIDYLKNNKNLLE